MTAPRPASATVDGSGIVTSGARVSPRNEELIELGIPGIGLDVGSPVVIPVYNAD
jgi:hypothetical protein